MLSRLHVLILEDYVADAELILRELREAGFELHWRRVETERDFLAQLDPAPDIILADYNLPQFDALTALHLLQERQLDVPFLIVTGSLSEEVAVQCMKQGASDYLLKDRLTRLGQAVRRALELKQLRDAKRQSEAALRESEQRFRLLAEQREVLLREIHHRVKNNLQIISSLLKLQAGYVKDEQACAMFKESQNRVRVMALIHEKLHRSDNLERIDTADYVRSLANHLVRSHTLRPEAFTLKINVDEFFLGVDTAIPCGLIINELVSNSLKHAFPAGNEGEIRIDLRSNQDKRLTLTVADNGIGFPGNVDFRNTQSLGLQLVSALTNQLGATIELHNGLGTTFKLTFEEIKYRERR